MTGRWWAWTIAVTLLLVCTSAQAQTWQSELYDDNWVPPSAASSPPSFENDKLIQDFSYAGYRRSEVDIPEVTGPVFDAVDDFGADPSGDTNTTAEIRDAIDAAAEAGGGVVYLQPGTYRVRPPSGEGEALRIYEDGIVLRGAGPDETRILNDGTDFRSKSVIRVDRWDSHGWSHVPDESPVVSIEADLLEPTVEVPVSDAGQFEAGDWVILRADADEEFAEEHNMGDLWGDQSVGPGVIFARQLVGVDEEDDILTIDVPTRYYLKTRDDARVHLMGPHIEEAGLEDFSIGMVEHPEHDASSGWGIHDYNDSSTHAYEVHGAYAVRMTRNRNTWMRNLHTFRPEENETEGHLLSNGVRVGHSVGVTIEDSHFERAFYSGGGGNAYMIRVSRGQEVLMRDSIVGYNRHGFVFSNMQTSGNVIRGGRAEHTSWRALPGSAGSSGSDHHMWLSQSNLVDGTELYRDYFAAFFRGTWGSNHGQTAVHSVFWNPEGLEYYSGRDYIVNTQQARYGYVIGTRGPAPGVSTAGHSSFSDHAWRTEPEDHVEGVGDGEELWPRSLFDHQLRRRMLSDGSDPRVSAPEIAPYGGTFTGTRYVELSTSDSDADIYYTLDGSAPTTDDYLYDDLIELNEDTNLRAVAVADGLTDSRHVAANFRIGDECRTVSDQWYNTPVPAQSGQFEIEFDVIPSEDEVDLVLGLGHGDADTWNGMAAIARLYTDGGIDARNGDTYDSDVSLDYEASTTYSFRMVVDIEDRSYDVYVRPDGEDEIALAENYDFRTEQTQTYRLDRFISYDNQGGGADVCDIAVSGTPDPEPSQPGNGDTETDTGTGGDVAEPAPDASDPDAGGPSDVGEPSDVGDDDQEIIMSDGCGGCSAARGTSVPLVVVVGLVALVALRIRRRDVRSTA